MKTIVTHGVNFHRDDVFAVATVITFLDSEKIKAKVIRTLEPEKYFGKADYIVDTGRKYNPKKGLFDHHQKDGAGRRKNGVPYASFGLVWKEFGKKITGSAYAADWIDRQIVQAIDADDCGMYLYKPVIEDVHPFLFGEYIRTACDVVKGALDNENVTSSKDKKLSKKISSQFDKEFMRLVNVAKDVLRVFIIKSKQKEEIMKVARKAYMKAKDKRIIISDIFIPSSFEEFKAPKYIEPLVFVYPDLRGRWAAKVIPSGGQNFNKRMTFPESWRGKEEDALIKLIGVPDAKFCHNSGFLASAESKEGILAMVKKSFALLKIV